MRRVTGIANSGKTTELCDIAKEHLNDDKRVLFIILESNEDYVWDKINEDKDCIKNLTISKFNIGIHIDELIEYLVFQKHLFETVVIDMINLINYGIDNNIEIIKKLQLFEKKFNKEIVYSEQIVRKVI